MKKYILAVLMIASITSYAQTKTTVEFENKTQSFDSVPEGTQLKIVYRFKNTGTTDFQVFKVSPTCGCTVAEFPKYPIAPGARDSIVATFDTNHRLGQQAKGVNLESSIGEINLIFMVLVTPGDGIKSEDEHSGYSH